MHLPKGHTLRYPRVLHPGLIYLDSVILQIEQYDALAHPVLLHWHLMDCLLEVGIETQHLQTACVMNIFYTRVLVVWCVHTCLSKATHAGFSPPTPLG